MSPEDAQRAAEQLTAQNREQEAERGAAQDRRELAERLKSAAKSLADDGKPKPNGVNESQQQPAATQGARKGVNQEPNAGQEEATNAASPGRDQRQSEQSGNGPRPEARGGSSPASGTPRPTPPTTAPDTPTPTPGRSDQAAPVRQQGEQPQPDRADTPATDANEPNSDGSTPTQDAPRGRQTHDPRRPSHQPEGDPKEPQIPDELPVPTKEAISKLARHLDKMTADDKAERADRAAAETAREQARRMAERLSPQQQDRLRQWAEGIARENPDLVRRLMNQPDGAPDSDQPRPDLAQSHPQANPRRGMTPDSAGTDYPAGGGPDGRAGDAAAARTAPPLTPDRTELVDARNSGREQPAIAQSRGQVAGEWLAPPAEGTAATTGPSPVERVRQAARSAQQAVDDRSIPARYDRMVRRYFQRLPDKVAERTRAEAPASVPAQDAP